MKITGIAARLADGGFEITATAFVPANEQLEGDDIARFIDLLKERIERDGAMVVAGEQGVAPEAPANPPSRSRRAGAAASTDAPAAEASTRRRRASQEGPTEPSQDTQPASTRRRRGAAEETSAPAATPAAAETGGRRRRATASTAETKSPSEVKDTDLTKMASQLASVFGPNFVMEMLAEKGAKSVNALKGDDRQWFLDEGNAEIANG